MRMRSLLLGTALVLATTITAGGEGVAVDDTVTPPSHQVVAIYFHRTNRCPTCKRIGAMAEQAVAKGFEKEAKTRTVEFHFVDFQDKKNAKLARTYGIESPTLVLLSVFEGETVCWTTMPKVWQLVGKPDEFRNYVHDGVVHYLKQTKQDAEKDREKPKESKE